MDKQTLDDVIGKYEQLFVSGSVPDCEVFLSSLPENCDARCITENLLFVELLHTDLEMRVRKGLKGRVEYYQSRFPQIAEDRDLVNQLIKTEFKVRQNYEPGLELAEYAKRFPALIYQSETEPTSNSNLTPDCDLVEDAIASHSDQLARFRKSHLHEKGGLGNVYFAKDTELNRPVAIKEIKAKFAKSKTHRSRFARETLITSHLEHPGIVPVYGLGHRSDGTPYFAMQFIEGKTLKLVISEYHTLASQSSKMADLEFRRLLQRFLDVCNTVQYAHSQGIIHRDLKPSNIMIGPFGKTYVVDWGLAKVVANCSSRSKSSEAASNSFSLFEMECDNTASVLGSIAGSPGFMSPEQTDGNADLIGVTSDIYSLGATLLNLITDRVPPDVTKIRAEGLTTHLSQFKIAPKHKRLKSVCAKAMSLEQEDRYESAEAMAEDIENYLLDLPLVAHNDSALEKLGRFSRTHRTIINTASVAMMFMLVLVISAATWINNERQTAVVAKKTAILERTKTETALKLERRAKHAADQSKLEAEKRTHQLTKTVRLFIDLFTKADERGLPRDLDKMTVNDALDELANLTDKDLNPIVKSFLNSLFASRHDYDGDVEKASAMHETALQLLQETGIPESDPLYLITLLDYGKAELSARRLEKSFAIAEQAVELSRVCDPCPDCGSSHRSLLVQALKLKYKAAVLKNQYQTADKAIDEAYELAQCIYAEKPALLMNTMYYKAEAQARAGRKKEARQLFENIIAKSEAQNLVHSRLIASRMGLAVLELESNNLTGAEKLFEQAFAETESLFGKTHLKTIHTKSQYATAMAWGTDPKKQAEGIALLTEIHDERLKQGNKSRAVDSALLLGVIYKRHSLPANSGKIITLIENTLQQEYTATDVGAKNMWSIYKLLCAAYRSSGQDRKVLGIMRKKLPFVVKLYGPSSQVVIDLKKQIAALEAGDNEPDNPDSSDPSASKKND